MKEINKLQSELFILMQEYKLGKISIEVTLIKFERLIMDFIIITNMNPKALEELRNNFLALINRFELYKYLKQEIVDLKDENNKLKALLIN